MEEKRKLIHCILATTMRELVDKANDLDINKEDIIQILTLNGVIYLIYNK